MIDDRIATALQENGSAVVSEMTVGDLLDTLEAVAISPNNAVILSSYVLVEEGNT